MDEKTIALAAEVLRTTVEEVEKNMEPLPEIDATYFWQPIRGGVAVIINSKGEKLAASSAVNPKDHIKAFKEGKRN